MVKIACMYMQGKRRIPYKYLIPGGCLHGIFTLHTREARFS